MPAFASVFAYDVDRARAAAFEAAYGSEGEWARFFRRADGHLGTELWRGEAPGRYLVVDRWTSARAYDAFLRSAGEDYRRRNAAAAALYLRETAVGRFDTG